MENHNITDKNQIDDEFEKIEHKMNEVEKDVEQISNKPFVLIDKS